MPKKIFHFAVLCFLTFPLILAAKNTTSGEIPDSEKATVAAPVIFSGDLAQNITEEEDLLIEDDTSVESEEDLLDGSAEQKKNQESKPTEEKIDTGNAAKEKESPAPSPATPDKKETADSKKPYAPKDTTAIETLEDIDDMDIILEEGDELIISDDKEELLITEEPKKDTAFPPEALKSKSDTATVTPDSLKQATTPVVEGEEIIGETETTKDTGTVGEEKVAVTKKPKKKRAKIEEASSINFAKNLKEYRSPRRAMFMSLLVPGLGQAYTKKYWKTAVVGVLEVALIGFAVKHSMDGNDQLERARNYADDHYDPEKFFKFYQNFMEFFKPDSPAVDFSMIVGDSLQNYISKYTGILEKSHDNKYRKDFDKEIQYNNLVQGWDDCEPNTNSSGYLLDSTNSINYLFVYKAFNKDTTWMLNRYNKGDTIPVERGTFGYSSHQREYNRLISLSNHYYNVSRLLIFSMVANHLLSAVDAFISARSYNDMLLNKKSVWQHIDLDHQVAFTDYGFESRLDLRVRF